MSDGIKTFKLIVQSSDACVELLRYINKNIGKINELNARVQIVKLADGELTGPNIDMLRAKGITRMPVLLTPADKPIIGVKFIKELFEKNLRQLDFDQRVSINTTTDVNQWWQNQISGVKVPGRKGASLMDDDDDNLNDNIDYSAKCADYMRRVPHYGRDQQGDEPAPRPRTPRPRGGGGGGRRPYPQDDDPDDNIADDQDYDDAFEEPQPMRRPTQGGRRPAVVDSRTAAAVAKLDPGADEMDKQMMAAWMDNNGGGGGDY